MQDKTVAGFVAGLIGGIAMNIKDYIVVFLLNWEDELYLEWGAMMIYGRFSENLAEAIFAQLGQLFFTGILGILFSVLIIRLGTKRYLIKGFIYGISVWFTIYAISIIFQVPNLAENTFNATVSNLIGAAIYGLVTAEVFKRLSNLNLEEK
ncbi:hypothetical protein MWH28_08755 [Natroniella sulfidigena]|uniref:DUF6789 family protein n=1 Tax=Natroniella sulfidigena TaxID=723921 RepID=UPI00200B3C32|nr:DUF6789 family protein [Natroniella sulfidigena]MCK8817447.1 hypothetical protein [Natroniella sulfidigena]